MVQGFQVFVTGAELGAHLLKRSEWHAERAKYYDEQQSQFNELPTRQMTDDPVKGLKEAGARHRQTSQTFAFYAAHVPADEVYQLSGYELQQLELLKDGLF